MRDETFGAAIHDVAETIQREGSVRAAFGDAIQLGTHSIVPVAIVSVGGGGGGGHVPRGRDPADARSAIALGLGVTITPVGFIHEEDGKVVYTPIAGTREAAPHAGAASQQRKGLVEKLLSAVRR